MNKFAFFLFTSLLLFTATTVTAQSRRQPLRFEISILDATTHRPRSSFVLGEPVLLRISLTNQGRAARTIAQLPDTTLELSLRSMVDYQNGPEIREGYVGGTGSGYYRDGMTFWTDRPPRMMNLAPGQTTSETIADVGEHLFDRPLQEGSHTLTVKYNSSLRATVSFRIILDVAKTIPLLEELAASASALDVNATLYRWADVSLNLARLPAISGQVKDTEGRPRPDVRMVVTGTGITGGNPPGTTFLETRDDGRYRLEYLTENGTYTITPEFPRYARFDEEPYTIEPASRTVSILNGKVTDFNFTATRVRVSTNVALKDEGAKAKASSILDQDFETENVIDGSPAADGWHTGSSGWNDGTPNIFPDWIEVDFGRQRRINWINVFTLPDDYKNPSDPEPNQTFTQYGITDFDVQYWTGRAWRTVPGGAIRSNRNVVRKMSFPELATNKIRVVVLNALGGESRITQIEAWHLNDLPQAKIAVGDKRNAKNVAKGETNSVVHFLTEVVDRDGTIKKYELDFGDKSDEYEWKFDHQKPGSKPQLTHNHVYEKEGTYTVKLRLVDDSNEANTTTFVVTITDPPNPTANQTSRNNSHRRQ